MHTPPCLVMKESKNVDIFRTEGNSGEPKNDDFATAAEKSVDSRLRDVKKENKMTRTENS